MDIENKVRKLLTDYNITSAPIPIEEIAVKLGLRIIPHNFGDHVSGAIFSDEEGNVAIGINVNESIVRRRFTIAHELGHYILDHTTNKSPSVFYDYKDVIFRNDISSRGVKPKEKEANAFAASILMPKKFIREELDKISGDLFLTDEQKVKRLASVFKVSQIAMSFRLANTGLFH